MKSFLLFFILGTFVNASTLKVTRIQIKGNARTSSEHIKKYINIDLDKSYSPEELKEKIEESEIRLSNLHYFYSNKILIVPLSEGKVKLLVRIQEGFLYRFGGSKYGVHFGKDNIFGNGSSLSSIIGLNNTAINIEKKYIFNLPFHLGLSASTLQNDLYLSTINKSESYREKSVISFITYSPHPTLQLQFRTTYSTTNLKSIQYDNESLNLGFLISYSFLNDILYPTEGFDLSVLTEHIKSEKKLLLKYFYYFPLSQDFSLKIKLSAGKTSSEFDITKQFSFKHFDGFLSDNKIKTGGRFAHLGELSLRQHIYSLSFLNIKLYGSSFFQIGNINNNKMFGHNDLSYGVGANFIFPAPVYTRIDFKYGISDLGNKFQFTIRADLGVFDEL